MTPPNQLAFLEKVYDKVGHDHVVEAMVEAFGVERVKNAVLALKAGD